MVKLANILIFLVGIGLVIWGFLNFDYSSLKILALSIGVSVISAIASEPYWSKQ